MTQLTIPNAQLHSLIDAVTDAGLPVPSIQRDDTTRQSVLTWTPDLTPAQIATLQTIQTLVVNSVLITPAERAAIQSDIDLLVTYQGIAIPTLAQTAAATKAQSRILRAILRS